MPDSEFPDTIFFDAVLRDFKADHPDFQLLSRLLASDEGRGSMGSLGCTMQDVSEASSAKVDGWAQ